MSLSLTPFSPIVTTFRFNPSRTRPLFFSLPKIIGLPCSRTTVLSKRSSLVAIHPCVPLLKITQLVKHSHTEYPLCAAAAFIIILDVGWSTSNVLAKKVPLAPNTNSAGRNGLSTVPNGDDLLTNPFGEVGEYWPFVNP